MPKHTCSKCDGDIKPLKRVVQYFRGKWEGAITPTPDQLFAEWHEKCFAGEFDLKPQGRPYRCVSCGEEVHFGERVSFFVKGEETTQSYTVAERRGPLLYRVMHFPDCTATRS